MKLTKVLVGLIAISLCGMATAAVKKGMSGADMRAGFLAAVKKGDESRAQEFLNALSSRADWGYYCVMITGDLGAMKDGETLITKYGITCPGGVVIPPRTPTDVKKPAPGPKPEPKGAVWDAAWGAEPDWTALTVLDEYSNNASYLKDEKKWSSDDARDAAKVVFAFEKKVFEKFKTNNDVKDTVKTFEDDATSLKARI